MQRSARSMSSCSSVCCITPRTRWGYLRRVRDVCSGMVIMETLVDAMDYNRPAMIFYEGSSENNDSSNYFGPNQLACEAMMREAGFKDVKMVDTFYGNRMVFHGFV